ncbi:unnamed protein product [Allacma fusca]|uniref:Uncharacterized protein n=1 Tax=Allacma fusca TaxID=39272 RepID=A0A8J2J2R8_9HEXA|nr:unnamed protein product [Allacma fusca]
MVLWVPPTTGFSKAQTTLYRSFLLIVVTSYDVWFANARGNNYSQEHTTLSPDHLKFWNFTYAVLYHEMGAGHSMGTMIFFIAMDRHPNLQQKRVNHVIYSATNRTDFMLCTGYKNVNQGVL